MTKNITMKPQDTITGLFNNFKSGNTYHVDVAEKFKPISFRLEASRRNKQARLQGIIGKREVIYSVSMEKKPGRITVSCA